ncbi:MAG: acyl-CoA thioesterase, partial [Pseudomonadota bacterium]
MSQPPIDNLARGRNRASHERQQDEGDIVIRTVAMPADTNPSGDIFGGWLMSQMDLAAGNIAGRVSGGRGATVSVEA